MHPLSLRLPNTRAPCGLWGLSLKGKAGGEDIPAGAGFWLFHMGKSRDLGCSIIILARQGCAPRGHGESPRVDSDEPTEAICSYLTRLLSAVRILPPGCGDRVLRKNCDSVLYFTAGCEVSACPVLTPDSGDRS
uniref:Uncharacterized protein n=1 Tax=Populus alba TaxID=43335 RepID=A0A4U5QFK5_POPAL|nr:hypothetical protein D5086_0000094410 [Populus alba]